MTLPEPKLLASRRAFLAGAAALTASGLLRSVSASMLADGVALPPELRAQKLAWAGVRLQLEKASLFIDPLANPDVWGPALRDKIVPLDARDGDRYVLVTHRHPDHFGPSIIRRILGETGTLVCDSDVVPLAVAAGLKTRVAPLYEPVLLGDFTATPVRASDGYGDSQVSWVVFGGGRRILHCGDTLWHGAWWRIGREYGPFDAAFLPINGARFEWRKPWSDVPAVMTPEQAVAASVVVGANLLVPIHYGVSGAEGYRELPDSEQELLTAARKRGVAVEIVPPGEWLTWQPRTAPSKP